MAGEKGRPELSFAALAEAASGGGGSGGGGARGHWAVLTGCRKGTVPAALAAGGPAAAERELRALIAAFGVEHTFVELWDHGDPLDSARNDALARLAVKVGVQPLASNNVHYATPSQRMLATGLAAIRSRRSLDDIDGWLPGGERRTCVRGRSRLDGSPATRGWWPLRPNSVVSVRSTWRSWRRSCRRTRVRRILRGTPGRGSR